MDYWTFSGSGSTNVIVNSDDLYYTQYNSSRAYINIVTTINYCGGAVQNVDGCNGNAMPAVAKRDAVVQSGYGGVVFAHEYGHGHSLPHIDTPANQIMNSTGSTSNTKINTVSNCSRFRSPYSWSCDTGVSGSEIRLCMTVSEWVEMGMALPQLAASGAPVAVPPLPGIEELAQSLFLDVVPVGATTRYDQADVQILRWMLQDPHFSDDRSRIVTLIGLISDGKIEDVEALYQYAQVQGADVGAAVIALGTLVARDHGNAPAMDVIEDFLHNGYAVEAGLGLAVSGTRWGHSILRQLSIDPKISPKERRHFELSATENRDVARLGLKAYYSERGDKPNPGPYRFGDEGVASEVPK